MDSNRVAATLLEEATTASKEQKAKWQILKTNNKSKKGQ